MIWLLLMACSSQADHDALQAEVEQLRTEVKQMRQELTALRVEAKGVPIPVEGPRCKPIARHHYETPHDLMSKMLLERSARAIPVADGYQLSAVREGRILATCGLRNGDTVHAIDDLPITSAQQALEAFEHYAKGEDFTLALTRDGEPLTLRYDRPQ